MLRALLKIADGECRARCRPDSYDEEFSVTAVRSEGGCPTLVLEPLTDEPDALF